MVRRSATLSGAIDRGRARNTHSAWQSQRTSSSNVAPATPPPLHFECSRKRCIVDLVVELLHHIDNFIVH